MEYSKASKRAKRDTLENSIGVFLSSKTIGYIPVNGGIGLIKDITNKLVY